MSYIRQISTLPLLAVLVFTASAAAADSERFYKWLDSGGIQNFSDRHPDDPAATSRQVLNAYGVTIRHLDEPMDDEAAAKRRELLRSGNRDLALVTSFNSEEELLRTHKEALDLLQSNIRISENAAERLRAYLAHLEVWQKETAAEVAGEAAQDGEPAEAEGTNLIEQARLRLAQQEADTTKLRQRHDRLVVVFASELQRYRELTETDAKTRQTGEETARVADNGNGA